VTQKRAQVAIVACRAADDAEPTDIYPDDDWPLLDGALARLDIEATLVSWDNTCVDWARFDLAVIRSTWDSVDRPAEYLSWARATARATTLLNPFTAIEWNLDKTYLQKLEARDVPIVPTRWVSDETQWSPPSQEFVVKPSISAGGRQTARYRPDEAPAADGHVRHLLACGQTVMVQDYVASVDKEGEAKLVFIGGRGRTALGEAHPHRSHDAHAGAAGRGTNRPCGGRGRGRLSAPVRPRRPGDGSRPTPHRGRVDRPLVDVAFCADRRRPRGRGHPRPSQYTWVASI